LRLGSRGLLGSVGSVGSVGSQAAPERMHAPWLGLRAQIVLALGLVFLLSFWLLGFATVQITGQGARAERARFERLLERALAQEWSGVGDLPKSACEALRARLPGVRVRLTRPGAALFSCGGGFVVSHGAWQGTRLANGAQLAVRLPDVSEPSPHKIVRLLLFYMALTGLSVVLFSYVLLTHLIVRPLERLTHSTEQFALGALQGPVAERGAAETVRLSRTFNRMAALLQAERAALTERLAELERTTRELQRTQLQLYHGEKLASVGRLAAGVAHEIGNPLTAIAGLIELLRSGELSDAQGREFLVRIAAETERINGIIRNLLDFARSDRADEPLQTCELSVVIEDAVSLVRPQKASRCVEIAIAVDPDVGEVLGSRARLTQVVLNLLLNALDALNGSGRVHLSVQRDERANAALLRVRDDGPGIAAEIAERLFEPFNTTKPVGKGTGLGLAVTHAIVEGLGGSIEGWNEPTGGACFQVSLPRAVTAPRI
jgi:signal transduction histidine kinase